MTMAKTATITQISDNEKLSITSPFNDMTVAQLEAILQKKKEAAAKAAAENKDKIITEVELYLAKNWNVSLSDLGLSEKTKRKAPETRTYIYKGWGAVSKAVLKEFGKDGKLDPALLQPSV